MKKSIMRGLSALAFAAVCGGAFGGDVWEFIADSTTGVSYGAGETITFRMRLLAPNYADPEEDRAVWTKTANQDNYLVQAALLADPAHYLENLNADYPLQLGVVANGKTYGATFVGAEAVNDKLGTDFTFRYDVKCGDFALPLRLAADGDGTPINAGKWSPLAPETGTKYFFFNGPEDSGVWKIVASPNGTEQALDPQMVSQSVAEQGIMTRVSAYNAQGDYLRGFDYRLETLEFDGQTTAGDDGETYWRVIRGQKSYPAEPQIRTADGLNPTENGVVVYAWIAPGDGDDDDPTTWTWTENDYAVTIPSDGGKRVSSVEFFDPDQNRSTDTPRKHQVYTFTLSPGTTIYPFTLKGQHVGGTARVILSSSPHWNTVGSTGSPVTTDYRVRTVYCGEQKPTLTVSLDNYDNPATFPDASHPLTDYTRAERLRVTLDGVDSHPAFSVKLAFDTDGDGNFPTNVIAISTDKAAGFLERNLLPEMTVHFAENATEATESADGLYLFVLGATKATAVSPGIAITPVVGAGGPTVDAINSLYVVVKGMQPIVTKPVGTAANPAPEIIIRGGGEKAVEIELTDSYRNLNLKPAEASNACYTVVWNPGNGLANQVITNDVNGLPLQPDSYGQLNVKVTYPKNDATNLASFYVINPEGLKSYWEDADGAQHAESYVRVVVTRPATATATVSAGGVSGDTFDEGLELDVRFALDQPDLQGRNLYAYLQPCNDAASNRCEATFFTLNAAGDAGKGILIWNQQGSTDDASGGLKLLDGPGSPQPKFKVVLCTSATYDPAQVVTDYESSEFPVKIMNVAPQALQLRMEGSSRYLRTSGATADVVRVNVSREFSVRSFEDVAADLNASDAQQVVLRWRLYELDDGDENVEPYEVVYTVGKGSVYTMPGLTATGLKKIVLQVQDKDMRPYGELRADAGEPGGWKYVMDKADDAHDWWEDDDNTWGPEFVVYVPVSDKPTVNVTAVGGETTLGGLQVFAESQLPPFSQIADPDMGFLVTLSEGYRDGAVTVKLELQYQDQAMTGVAPSGYVTVGVTSLVFNKNSTTSGSRTRNVPLTDFDGTWRDDLKRLGYAVWRLKATVESPDAAKAEVPTGYADGECDFYVRNEAPRIYPEAQFTDCMDPSNAYEVVKNGSVTIGYTLEDIEADLTNGMKVVCTMKGGEVIGEATLMATGGVSVATGEFTVRVTSAGLNYAVIRATDKDQDFSEIKLYFYVEPTRNLLLYPAKPTSPSTDSDDIADYFSAAGIGYGRVWASSQLAGIQYWIHTWTSPGTAEAVLAYAKGYAAGEQEQRGSSDYSAFVAADGTDTGNPGYKTPLSSLDSFFYRWFTKVASDSNSSSSWTAYRPVPQLSKVTSTVAAQTVLSLSFPQSAGSGTTVYNDISALAVFSREYLWSDNMGDINGDGVPDSYVMKYKLTGGDYAAGADLADVNYETDGKTPYCQDYLPLTDAIAYSKLIPELTSYDNLKNARAFTPKLKLRGYDEHLNDATAERFPDGVGNGCFVDGAKPEKVYECADGSYDPATCTVSKLEYLAWRAYKATHPGATFDSWSPERPTDPTKADTDNDGFTDGFEYYWWYRAHVGYMETDANGEEVRRTVTGRRYDPRNPGEGALITSEEIARAMDPLTGIEDVTRDTDNDGLPDLLEFEIGTNPFDFDTDGDGLPDGFEIMLGGTDPLRQMTTTGISDAMRNYDGDAMAFTTPALEQAWLPKPKQIEVPVAFALVDANGDTDGIQWYVAWSAPTNLAVDAAAGVPGTTFRVAGDETVYFTEGALALVDGRLAADLPPATTWTTTNAFAGVELQEGEVIGLMPTRLAAGTAVTVESETAVSLPLTFTGEGVKGCHAAWRYGRSVSTVTDNGDSLANLGGFGMLAIGRYQNAPAGQRLAAVPAADPGVAYLHYLVYQQFGFDPRTAWNAKTPLAARWGKTVSSGGETETVDNNYAENYGYAGIATRTREYTLYDEFLLLSFFLNNGTLAEADVTPNDDNPWETIWSRFTTNGRGPNEPDWEESEHYQGRVAVSDGATADNGADTDGDGVPDGWELYVMAGPKSKQGKFVFAGPYNDGYRSSFGPFVADAAKASVTDNEATGGNGYMAGDGDGLTELQEFAGTDSCAHYAEYSTTIKRPEEHKTWFNKFFPTDPWNKDTDGDGLSDSEEAGKFAYGDVDTGSTCIPGGGLNPLSVDTDGDGLPDGWEAQFAGKTVYVGENAQWAEGTDADGNPGAVSAKATLQGYCDGMDGTVFDAYNSPRVCCASGSSQTQETAVFDELVVLNGVNQVVDRDYDRDGLENWQEYLTGAMLCWRYDFADLGSGWNSYVPDSAYFPTGVFSLSRAMEYTGIEDEDEFWYETLFNRNGKFYNPHLVTGMSPGSHYFFSRVTNGWDTVYTDEGSYYIFKDRVNEVEYKDLLGFGRNPGKYICTSPIKADSDQDGMDDYYELFHGMNPLLGSAGVRENTYNPCDLVFDAWGGNGDPMAGGDYDFRKYPWQNGLVDADPDGDDIRNQDEAIMPLVAPSTTWYHTDPTPLWMTDSSYARSLTRLFYRMPDRRIEVFVPERIVHEGKTYYLRDCDGFGHDSKGRPILQPFTLDRWLVTDPDTNNWDWLYSFEENEGFDTDHDAAGDNEELAGKFRSKTDPLDADSPRRRQAMYFQGPENPSALQSMPFVAEAHPRTAIKYPDDLSLLQYTVECWVRPDTADDATVVERAVYVNRSHVADERLVRCNFRLAVRSGRWYTMFDDNGTLDAGYVEVLGATAVEPGKWTYVAATYDAKQLKLYVNGEIDGTADSNLKPAYGASAVVVVPSAAAATNETSVGALPSGQLANSYWFDMEYPVHAFLVGASFRSAIGGNHLNVMNGAGWEYYRDFFKGYVDEIRVWDGALSADRIADDHYVQRKRYTREDALANQSAFYSQWLSGRRRYSKDGNGSDLEVEPELRFHWSFDSVPGAENAASVATAPRGFIDGGKAEYSRPEGYVIPWWSAVVDAYGSVYAGQRNWVTWIPNTIAHLPRFDATTLDSAYWRETHAGDVAGTYKFARTAEPVSKWTQALRHGTTSSSQFWTTARQFWLANNTGTNAASTLSAQFEFTGRHLNQTGDDLLPLGGAFVRYVDEMWDDGTASDVWDLTGSGGGDDGLPDWWRLYAEQNYREGLDPETPIRWDTVITYVHNGIKLQITAGEAYLRDLAKGTYVDSAGKVHVGPTEYAQEHMSDGLIADWWKQLMKIDGADPLADNDHDGLSNYAEYLASEKLSLGVLLDPRLAKTDTRTLDYFRPFGKLYLGEMLTDHDLMEDHWERSLGDARIASASLWDATKDADEDGWSNFAENRYNGYSMSTLAQLVSHAVGSEEVLDLPIPSVKLRVRYNGTHLSAGTDAAGGASNSVPNLVVAACSQDAATGDYVLKPDATWTLTPGQTVARSVYVGGWEDRVVHGTLAPGNVDVGNFDINFAQVPQSDVYSWTDESGLHLAGTYAEFLAALQKNPAIIQNVQEFKWSSFIPPANEYVSSDRAVTLTRDALTQQAHIALYGERIGTVNLTTGDFELDLSAIIAVVEGTYSADKGQAASWSLKEAIFRVSYSARIPSAQTKVIDVSLAQPDSGFVRGGLNALTAFYDLDGDGAYTPGEPFGVLNDVELGWCGRSAEIELTDMSAITPRVNLWGGSGDTGAGSGTGSGAGDGSSAMPDSDRGDRVGTATFTDGSNRFETATAPAPKSRVRVVRYKVDDDPVYRVGVSAGVVLDKTFEEEARPYLAEGDFLTDGRLDIDWDHLYDDVVSWRGTIRGGDPVTNVTYLIVYNWDESEYDHDADTALVKASPVLVTRRFERTRTVPTPCPERAVFNLAQPTFAWKIENEDTWASWFGTTYTGFKVRVKDADGQLVYDSGIRRLPARDSAGVYSWTAPLYAGSVAPGTGVRFENLANYTWEVALYNAKFKTDTLMSFADNGLVNGNPFSTPEQFRMNVTTQDASSERLAVRVCYAGPATDLARVRVQAFASPDFTGDPAAEITLDAADLDPSGTTANATLSGLPAGYWFLRAYIDTNGNGVRDEWESWGYLCERDRASKAGIFGPVAVATAMNPATEGVRKLFIEDCDTDGDYFPDVWEAEQNGNVFDRTLIGPVTGSAELIGVNTNLVAMLDAFPALTALASANGFSLASGISLASIGQTTLADGSVGFTVDNRVESVEIASLAFDANGNVAISVEAATTATAADGLSSFYTVVSAATKTVTCRVYCKTDLASEWGTPVAESRITVGAGEVTVTVDRAKTGAASAFFKVEIAE
ncbi:MAG: LamG-like jellyroll fold domain-containing protein [Kiritimatiellia bacterium]